MQQLERLYKIDRMLARGRVVPRNRFLEELEISRATFMRDIEYLRLFFQAPIVYVRRPVAGYRYDAEQGQLELPGIWFTDRELSSLLVAMGMLSNLQSELLQPMLKPILERLEGLLAKMGYDRERISVSASLHPLGLREVSQPIFEQLTQAVLQSAGLRIAYHARYNDTASQRKVDPQRLILHRDNWYLVAYCHQVEDLRVFACDRILSAESSPHARSEIAPTEIGERLALGFGIFMGSRRAKTASQVATLLFTPERARWVRDEQWHPRQKGRTEADGSYRLELPYENATELVLEILRHGSQVQVLGPPALRETVAKEWQRAAALYSAAPSAKS